mgnify:CR=1 FL=1
MGDFLGQFANELLLRVRRPCLPDNRRWSSRPARRRCRRWSSLPHGPPSRRHSNPCRSTRRTTSSHSLGRAAASRLRARHPVVGEVDGVKHEWRVADRDVGGVVVPHSGGVEPGRLELRVRRHLARAAEHRHGICEAQACRLTPLLSSRAAP